jgi:hypothetical protein
MNDLDKAEIRNVVSGLINPTPRDRCVTLNYERAAINIELLLTLGNTQQFQVISMITRSTFEAAVELALIKIMPDAAEKIAAFSEVEKLKSATKIVAFKNAYPDAKVLAKTYEEFIRNNEQRIVEEKARLWPNVKKVSHWSMMDMASRARKLGRPYDDIYQISYSQLSWYVHSGTTGVANIDSTGFAFLCGTGFAITVDSYLLILERVIDEFKISQADEKLKAKIQFAKMVPFADSPGQGQALRAALLS